MLGYINKKLSMLTTFVDRVGEYHGNKETHLTGFTIRLTKNRTIILGMFVWKDKPDPVPEEDK